eukprot:Clim_evm35s151 gene=Clim_evmTU35s151
MASAQEEQQQEAYGQVQSPMDEMLGQPALSPVNHGDIQQSRATHQRYDSLQSAGQSYTGDSGGGSAMDDFDDRSSVASGGGRGLLGAGAPRGPLLGIYGRQASQGDAVSVSSFMSGVSSPRKRKSSDGGMMSMQIAAVAYSGAFGSDGMFDRQGLAGSDHGRSDDEHSNAGSTVSTGMHPVGSLGSNAGSSDMMAMSPNVKRYRFHRSGARSNSFDVTTRSPRSYPLVPEEDEDEIAELNDSGLSAGSRTFGAAAGQQFSSSAPGSGGLRTSAQTQKSSMPRTIPGAAVSRGSLLGMDSASSTASLSQHNQQQDSRLQHNAPSNIVEPHHAPPSDSSISTMTTSASVTPGVYNGAGSIPSTGSSGGGQQKAVRRLETAETIVDNDDDDADFVDVDADEQAPSELTAASLYAAAQRIRDENVPPSPTKTETAVPPIAMPGREVKSNSVRPVGNNGSNDGRMNDEETTARGRSTTLKLKLSPRRSKQNTDDGKPLTPDGGIRNGQRPASLALNALRKEEATTVSRSPSPRVVRREIHSENLTERPTEEIGPADFELLKVLGTGAFAKVFLVRKKYGHMNGRIFAMKALKKATIIYDKKILQRTLAERNILEAIRHPFIVSLYYAFQTGGKLYLILEYCSGGELFNLLHRKQCLSESEARFYVAEVLLALENLHDHGIIYRDLKLENILLDRYGHVKLTDFGLSKEHVHGRSRRATSFCGTLEYMAPEVIEETGHGKSADWWSLGILLYELVNGTPPFSRRDEDNRSKKELMEQILCSAVPYPDFFSVELTALLRGLLTHNPDERLGGGPAGSLAIKEHAFFRPIDWETLYAREMDPPFNPELENEVDTANFDPYFTSMQPINSPTRESISGRFSREVSLTEAADGVGEPPAFDPSYTSIAQLGQTLASNSGGPIRSNREEATRKLFKGFSFVAPAILFQENAVGVGLGSAAASQSGSTDDERDEFESRLQAHAPGTDAMDEEDSLPVKKQPQTTTTARLPPGSKLTRDPAAAAMDVVTVSVEKEQKQNVSDAPQALQEESAEGQQRPQQNGSAPMTPLKHPQVALLARAEGDGIGLKGSTNENDNDDMLVVAEECGDRAHQRRGSLMLEGEHEECIDLASPFLERYKIHPTPIGSGVFSTCYRATDRRTGQDYAVKVVSKLRAKRNCADTDDPYHEVEMLNRCQGHRNIVKLVDVMEDELHVYILTELLKGPNLFDRIRGLQSAHFTEAIAAQLVDRIARAVRHMHRCGVAHRDLRPENLIFESNAADADLKIADFGFAKDLEHPLPHHGAGTGADGAGGKDGFGLSLGLGSSPLHPALIGDIAEQAAMAFEACDLWSLGVITYTLLCGYPPFRNKAQLQCQERFRGSAWQEEEMLANEQHGGAGGVGGGSLASSAMQSMRSNPGEIMQAIKAGEVTFPEEDWSMVSDSAKDFILTLLQMDHTHESSLLKHQHGTYNHAPSDRWTIFQTLRHPWLVQHCTAPQTPRSSLEKLDEEQLDTGTTMTGVLERPSTDSTRTVTPANIGSVAGAAAREKSASTRGSLTIPPAAASTLLHPALLKKSSSAFSAAFAPGDDGRPATPSLPAAEEVLTGAVGLVGDEELPPLQTPNMLRGTDIPRAIAETFHAYDMLNPRFQLHDVTKSPLSVRRQMNRVANS